MKTPKYKEKCIAHCTQWYVSLVDAPMLVRNSDTCGLIHYSANQLGHGRRSAEKSVTKTKHLIGFCFIGRTRWTHGGKYFMATRETLWCSFFYISVRDKIGPIFQNSIPVMVFCYPLSEITPPECRYYYSAFCTILERFKEKVVQVDNTRICSGVGYFSFINILKNITSYLNKCNIR